MSNLLKSVYFNMDPQKMRVIDSDERVEQFIPNIFQQPVPEDGEAEDFIPMRLGEEDGEEENYEDGLSVISMDDLMSKERAKLSQQMKEEQEAILSEAREQAEHIISEANGQAEGIKMTAMEEGRQEGLAQGQAEAAKELSKLREELQAEFDAKQEELLEQEKSFEPAFADLVVSLVKKITGVVCEDKREVILYLIGNAMHNLGKTKQIVLRVSKHDISRVSAKKAALKSLAGDITEFDVVEDDSLGENQCIIETDNKIIDCSLDAQLQNLEEHIKLLLY